MRSNKTTLLTCRYWALGPHCPNITVNGNYCGFAHYDTGRLASHIDQRGTCQWWLKRQCTKTQGCFYEHRHTGVPGLYQGTLELDGFEFEVAETASKAGFNTLNHAALFDLIWNIKRIVINTARPKRTQPPKDSIYPDRYRPSGIGDNTRKRRRPVNREKSPQFRPIPPLDRRVIKDEKENLTSSRLGTQANPICLEPEHNAIGLPIRPTKRSKHSHDRTTTSKALPEPINHVLIKRQEVEIIPKAMERIKIDSRADASVDTTLRDLDSVRKKLLQTQKIMAIYHRTALACRTAMKVMFDREMDRFDDHKINSMLEDLAVHINQVENGAEAGVLDVEQIISWIHDNDGGAEIS